MLTCVVYFQRRTVNHVGRPAPYRANNGNLCKFGATYRHGTMFAPRWPPKFQYTDLIT